MAEDSNIVDKALDATVEPVLATAKGAVDSAKEKAKQTKDAITGAEAAKKTPVDEVKGGVKKGIGAVMKGLATPLNPVVRLGQAAKHTVDAAKELGGGLVGVVDGDVDKAFDKDRSTKEEMAKAGKAIVRALPPVHFVETAWQGVDGARDVVRGSWRYVFGDKKKSVDSGWTANGAEFGDVTYIHRRPIREYENEYGERIMVDEARFRNAA